MFVTTEFGATPTGPSVYAHYLWEELRDDPEVEFHLVAPEFAFKHPRAHSAGRPRGSLELYDRLCRTALKTADDLGDHVILHANNSHMGRRLLGSRHRLWGQLNDYQNADVYHDLPRILRHSGLRRALALIRRRWLERRLVARQELTICNSHYTRRRIIEAYRPPHPERAVVVYKAVDIASFQRPEVLPPDPAGREPGRFRIILVGSDFVVKGLDLLVEACLAMAAPVHLCAVGVEQAAFATRFPALADRLRESRVGYTFVGRQPRQQVRVLLWHSDLFAMPTRSEALGVAILEALAAGLPVVATRVGGVPEILEGRAHCELVPAHDGTALRQALERQADHRGGAAGGVGQVRLEEAFSRPGMIRRLRAHYLGLPA